MAKIHPEVRRVQTLIQKMEPYEKRTVSFSQLQTYMSCPFKWQLRYVEQKIPFEQSIHLLFGTAFHETVQDYLHTAFTDSVSKADATDFDKVLADKMSSRYKEDLIQNGKIHYTTLDEQLKFHEQGVAILKNIKNKRRAYFSSKSLELVGIEIPLKIPLSETIDYKGFIDIVFFNTVSEKFIILDFKTSTSGWNQYAKKDPKKINQLLLYKRFFSEQFDIPESKIEVEFFIVRRDIKEDSDFPLKRIQTFAPAAGPRSVNTAVQSMYGFIQEGFKADGSHSEKTHSKTKDSKECRWCNAKTLGLCTGV